MIRMKRFQQAASSKIAAVRGGFKNRGLLIFTINESKSLSIEFDFNSKFPQVSKFECTDQDIIRRINDVQIP